MSVDTKRTVMKKPSCINAGADAVHAKRKAESPGPLCASCHREVLRAEKVKAKAAADKLRSACIDCRAEGLPLTRPATSPGPRCATHKRAHRLATRARNHESRVQKVYGLSDGEYQLLYEAQGGRCAWPKCRATGKIKKLAVDHDHACCPGSTSCGRCVRGLMCGHHNQEIGRNGDDPEVFIGVASYLRRPPAPAILLRYDGEPDTAA